MKFYLVGANGRLGKALALEYESVEITALSRSVYEDWSLPGKSDLISRFFGGGPGESATIFVASGLLNPGLSREDLLRVNYQLPKNVIEGATKLGIKVITFGTIMEALLHSKNPYVQTKVLLSEYVDKIAADECFVMHLQIHTLFGGGQPSSFMFLGQMLSAILANKPFKMTSGRQLREYHHLTDEARVIKKIAESSVPGVTSISHGKPLSLKAIAENVFSALGKSELLHVGALPDPYEENYHKILKPTELVNSSDFRESLPAIVEYMRGCYARNVVKK